MVDAVSPCWRGACLVAAHPFAPNLEIRPMTNLGRPTSYLAIRLAAAGIAVLVIALAAGTLPSGRATALLSDRELARVVGDSTAGHCTQQVNCNAPRGDGTYCTFCENAGMTFVCCGNDDPNKKCVYDGAASACNGAQLYRGATIGETGTCGSCTAQNFAGDGQCITIVNASGDGC